MRYLHYPMQFSPACRRLLTPIFLAGYLLTAMGFPLSSPGRQLTPGSLPYPCQGHRCGCPDAESCWKHCCCFTPKQLAAWAAAHHVGVPPGDHHDPHGEHGSLDGHEDLDARADAEQHVAGTCCAKKSQPPSTPTLRNFRCGGVSTFWVTCGAAMPAPLQDFSTDLSPVGWIESRPPLLAHRCDPPLERPPQALALA